MRLIARTLYVSSRFLLRIREFILSYLFGAHGQNFRFDPDGMYSYSNIFVGHDVSLGRNPILLATRSRIQIGNHVMFGPEVTIRGGNHRIDMVGRFMTSIEDTEKRIEDDQGVVIEDDVWVGTRAIILHGVTIGRGSVIGAGAVVTKSVPPYAIAAGVPARVVRFRWDTNTILEHEKALYPDEQRLKKEDIESWQR